MQFILENKLSIVQIIHSANKICQNLIPEHADTHLSHTFLL